MNSRPEKKPAWLKVRFPSGPNYSRIDRYHRLRGLNSVCRSAACPNQGECWSRGTATFMILGDRCTRNCTFCNVTHDIPLPPDPKEGENVARAVAELALKHAVVTSVTRDDLPDGGASRFADLVRQLRHFAPECKVELLIPDLRGDLKALGTILDAGPDILGHNIETVPRLYTAVRRGASYERSLDLLATAGRLSPATPTKSGLMLGMEETRREVLEVMEDLRRAGCSLLTLGQYLAPSRRHHPVGRFVPPEEFEELKLEGERLGFSHVEAGPLVRSSYHAEKQFEEASHGND